MSDFESINSAEYAYEKKAEGGLLIKKILLIVLYVLFVGAFFLFCYLTRIIPLFAVCPIFLWILVFFTWRFVSFDISYTFEHGTLTFSRVFRGLKGKMRVKLVTIHTKTATRIAPYRGEALHADKIHELSSSRCSERRIVIETLEDDGKRIAVIFDTTERIASLLCSFAKAQSTELKSALNQNAFK